jgi:hypothetical protein
LRCKSQTIRIALLLVLGVRLVVAEEVGPPPPLRAHVTVLGQDAASTGVREVVAELLVREGFAVLWSYGEIFRPQDVLDRQGEELAAIGVWIDLTSLAEARLYFRDSHADRFFIRSLSLGQGLDEIAKEEIGHIVASAVLALGQGNGQALTRSEASQALGAQPAQASVSPVPPVAGRPLRVEIATSGGVQAFSRDLPLAGLLTVSAAVTRGPRWGRANGSFGAWLDLGYQIPVRYEQDAVGVKLQAMSLRAGGLWQIERRGTVVFRLGIGGGVDRVDFWPHGNASGVDVAPKAEFYVPALCSWGGLDLRLAEHVAVTARVFADIALMDVHYDVQDSSGASTRVLSPLAVRPGGSLGMAVVF